MRIFVCLILLCVTLPLSAQDKRGFDPKSFQRTWEWSLEMWPALQDAATARNELAMIAAEKKIVDAVLAFKGKQVEWDCPAIQISREGIMIRKTTKLNGEEVWMYVSPKLEKAGGDYFAVAPEDWVLKLRAGDLVRMTATVTDASVPSRGTTKTLRVTLSGYKLSPVK